MMNSRDKACCFWITVVLLSISSYIIWEFSTKRGTVCRLRELPVFGKWLPPIEGLDITYECTSPYKFLDARFECNTNVFEEICAYKKLSVTRYDNGFSKESMVTENLQFMPQGPNIWYAFDMFEPFPRRTIMLLYEPPEPAEPNKSGMLFMSIR